METPGFDGNVINTEKPKNSLEDNVELERAGGQRVEILVWRLRSRSKLKVLIWESTAE
jgi:hypothetical protein